MHALQWHWVVNLCPGVLVLSPGGSVSSQLCPSSLNSWIYEQFGDCGAALKRLRRGHFYPEPKSRSLKARNLSTWECNWVIGGDKQSQYYDQVHLTRYTVSSWHRAVLCVVCVYVCVLVCVCLIEPLRCSPPGLLDIISHYPRHSSNTAGAREQVRLAGAPSSSSSSLHPLCLPFFFCRSFTHLPSWGLSKRNSQEARADANLWILEEPADVVRKRGGEVGGQGGSRTADDVSIFSFGAVPTAPTTTPHPQLQSNNPPWIRINLCDHIGTQQYVKFPVCNLLMLLKSFHVIVC